MPDDLVTLDVLSKTVFREVGDRNRRWVRVAMFELANEVGLALHACGFSTLVALEITSEAAMGMWCREATASIPRQLFDAASRVNTRNYALFHHVLHNAATDEAAQASLARHLPAQEVPAEAVRQERRSDTTAARTRVQKRRANPKSSGNAAKLSQDSDARRLVKDKGEFLTLLNVIHIVARKDTYQDPVSGHPFGFWEIPEVPAENRNTMKALGDYLKDHFSTETLTSVELQWGLDYLMDHYSTLFPGLEEGLEVLDPEREKGD
jgi:hypothetical protein